APAEEEPIASVAVHALLGRTRSRSLQPPSGSAQSVAHLPLAEPDDGGSVPAGDVFRDTGSAGDPARTPAQAARVLSELLPAGREQGPAGAGAAADVELP